MTLLTITVDEAARLLGLSRGTAFESVRSGRLPSVRLSAHRLAIPIEPLAMLLGTEPNVIAELVTAMRAGRRERKPAMSSELPTSSNEGSDPIRGAEDTTSPSEQDLAARTAAVPSTFTAAATARQPIAQRGGAPKNWPTEEELCGLYPEFAEILGEIRGLPQDVCPNEAWISYASGHSYNFFRRIMAVVADRDKHDTAALCYGNRALRECHLGCCGYGDEPAMNNESGTSSNEERRR